MRKRELRSDAYRRARGGYSRLLALACAQCGTHLFYYQKDGAGELKRAYLDRIRESPEYENLHRQPIHEIPELACPHCNERLGTPEIYSRETAETPHERSGEGRKAFRLFQGAVRKKIVPL